MGVDCERGRGSRAEAPLGCAARRSELHGKTAVESVSRELDLNDHEQAAALALAHGKSRAAGGGLEKALRAMRTRSEKRSIWWRDAIGSSLALLHVLRSH